MFKIICTYAKENNACSASNYILLNSGMLYKSTINRNRKRTRAVYIPVIRTGKSEIIKIKRILIFYSPDNIKNAVKI